MPIERARPSSETYYTPGTLGVIGGLGPFASAAFLRTIYEYGAHESEQRMPSVMLCSDPSVPDRTATLLNGTSAALVDRLRVSVGRLLDLQCSRVVVCCVTMHAVIPQLPEAIRRRIISLIDVAIDQACASGERQLLFCSAGTRATRVFERHERWAEVEPWIVLPEPADQEAIHQAIYAIKRTGDARPHLETARVLLDRYGVQSLIAGCTEFHLLTRAARRRRVSWRACDPLDRIARAWVDGLAHDPAGALVARSIGSRGDNV